MGPGDDPAAWPDDPRIRRVPGDVRSAAGLADLFVDLPPVVDVVHAAGVIHPAAIDDLVEVNVRGTDNVARLARRAGVRRLVHVSSNSPFGVNPHPGDVFRNEEPYRPHLGYGRSKMLAELRLLDEVAAGLDAVIVRPPWFYGPHQPRRQTTFFTLVRAGRFPLVGDGRQRRSMVYLGNLVQGVVRAELAAVPPGRGWWIADADPYPLRTIVDTVKGALVDAGYDVARRQVRVPVAASRMAERADRSLQRIGRYHTQLHVLGELRHTIACDVSTARAELGYDPDVELAEGMAASVRWCRDQGIAL
jgi:nucleoside-diphosphate-sugar epimerase